MKRRSALLRLAAVGIAPTLLGGCAEFGTGYDERDTPRESPIRWPEGKPRAALVLGSGGPRGFAHVGVLKVLERNNIEPSLVVGASAGAIVGALYAARLPVSRIETLALDLGLSNVVDPALFRPNRFIGRALQNLMNQHVAVERIEDLPRRFCAVAASLASKRLVAFSSGNVGAAVRASAALPDYFLPTRIGDVDYEDGDTLSPVPIRVARRLGATHIVAVDVSAWKEDEPDFAREAWKRRDAERRAIIDEEGKDADYLFRVRLPYLASVTRAYRENVIALAEQQTQAAIDRIRSALSRT